ncbi:hypothetical protein [Paenibacillus sp. NEAU-GSW1]|uniref:hypothetical protein n=1 Tax=Paenibacillus sp. NEAU-GSW1 TaxID=2682486 RepID=UPI0012E22C4C|nr:hypothetical protein [Paenibacillus sp. NEAU-GSW1]MUT68103.1 hypothetical protein [Paenibacillus sp. NEAU-GSW1]
MPVENNLEYAKNQFENVYIMEYYGKIIRSDVSIINPDRFVLYDNELITGSPYHVEDTWENYATIATPLTASMNIGWRKTAFKSVTISFSLPSNSISSYKRDRFDVEIQCCSAHNNGTIPPDSLRK